VPADLAPYIQHTLLAPDATAEAIDRLCAEAVGLGLHAVCVNPYRVGRAVAGTAGSPVVVCSVVGFPFGASHPQAAVTEAAVALAEGAAEIDMVINVGALKDGEHGTVEAGISAVRGAVHRGLLKVIIEAAALTPDELRAAVDLSARAGADLVKTSTGYHPAGGATVADVAAMRAALDGRPLGIKASGGVRAVAFARELIAAGATRLGTSSGVALAS
jgi:deoxyribose-phosphate aldolase